MLLRPVTVNQTPAIKPELAFRLYSIAGARENWSLDGEPVEAGRPLLVTPGIPENVVFVDSV